MTITKKELIKEIQDIEFNSTIGDWSIALILDEVKKLASELEELPDAKYTKKVLKLNDSSYLRVIHFDDNGRFNSLTSNPFEATDVSMTVGNINHLGGEVVELKLIEERKRAY